MSSAMKLTDRTEILEYVQSKRDSTNKNLLVAERRTAELNDEFTRLEVQIAAIIFAFMGFFSNSIETDTPLGVKIAVVLIFVSLILSLAFGLVHMKRKEYYWEEMMVKRNNRYLKWDLCAKEDTSYDEAFAFHEGTIDGGTQNFINCSPKWTWVMQTVALAVAVFTIFILLLIFLFN